VLSVKRNAATCCDVDRLRGGQASGRGARHDGGDAGHP
jgi:hypothetical protein